MFCTWTKKLVAVAALASQSFAWGADALWTPPSGWATYVQAIALFQKHSPGSYPSWDLRPLDRLNPADLAVEVQRTIAQWEKAGGASSKTQKHRELIQISREANDRLDRMFRAGNMARSLESSAQLAKQSPTEFRITLSPFDEVFQKTKLGQKVQEDLGTDVARVSRFRLDTATRRLVLETSAREPVYQLQLKPVGTQQVLRGSKWNAQGRVERVGADLLFKPDTFGGALFNPSGSKVAPFGKFPEPSKTWLDEKGESHFKGDGCGHQH